MENAGPLLEELPRRRDELRRLREIVLANAVMFGEIPAPTFGEDNRIRFLIDRFTEEELQNISVDEYGNGTAVLPGKKGERNILVVAHADTVFDSSVNHSVTLHPSTVAGPGIADNSIGLATVASLPTVLRELCIELDDNLILLGATRSLGHGDLAGLRFYLDNVQLPIRAGVCVEGVHLGRLSYSCLGMLRAEIICRTADEPGDRMYEHAGGAIVDINRIVSRILAIPTPQVPRTSIILGSVNSGKAFNTPSSTALLRFEVRSEEAGVVSRIQRQIQTIVDEINSETEADAEMRIIARRRVGGISFDHPMVQVTREIMQRLGVKPKIGPSTGELSALIAKDIPSITLGLTHGENVHEPEETVHIEPLFSGLAQLVGVLQATDQGLCDGPDEED